MSSLYQDSCIKYLKRSICIIRQIIYIIRFRMQKNCCSYIRFTAIYKSAILIDLNWIYIPFRGSCFKFITTRSYP